LDVAPLPLTSWENFYVIVGSSGAALTGLQFVVIALVAESRQRSSLAEIDAFGTPTVVHFCTVLLISALMSAPWHGLSSLGVLLGVLGVSGVGYVAVVLRRARKQQGYRPVWEDWLWHTVLPLVAYFAVMIAGALLSSHTFEALFIVGAVSVLLLFIGIHNAWDTVTYIAVARKAEALAADETPSP
jgi:hypothetical protein